VAGIVSVSDIIHVLLNLNERVRPEPFGFPGRGPWIRAEAADQAASELMTTRIVTGGPDTSVRELTH
jgi:hypothetical protein